jgi:hypothetical protein
VIAIENARLFNETREARHATSTFEGHRLSPSDVQPVFDVIVERAALCAPHGAGVSL